MSVGAACALEQFLLPNSCVACDRLLRDAPSDGLLCSLCRSRCRVISGGCGRCGQPTPPVGPCRFCQSWPSALEWVRSAVWLGDEAREIVHHLKYEGFRALGADAAHIIARAVRRPTAAVLVPVPLARRRRRDRGYNQAAEIAGPLGECWGIPVNEQLLRRSRDTRSQTALSPEARAANVGGAFEAAPCGVRAAAGPAPAIILVDDVLTTGATLAAAAQALELGGWRRVGAVTFARALPFASRATGG